MNLNIFKRFNNVYQDAKKYRSLFVPPGHYYSPISSPITEEKHNEYLGFTNLTGIDINEAQQLINLDKFQKHYGEIPFSETESSEFRYYFKNNFYSYSDSIILYSFLREFAPNRIIEIGSGFSSSVILDTNQRFFNNKIEVACIEPYASRLKGLLKEEDNLNIIEKDLQKVDVSIVEKLEENDILLIDSTHISKSQSDVNYYMFELFPKLKSGVLIHIHDIFYPFEYPLEWINMGRSWNELYLLRAFLTHNKEYQIEYFNDFMGKHHSSKLKESMPLCLNNTGGSIWLRKL